jgi:hypothetical protein
MAELHAPRVHPESVVLDIGEDGGGLSERACSIKELELHGSGRNDANR